MQSDTRVPIVITGDDPGDALVLLRGRVVGLVGSVEAACCSGSTARRHQGVASS
jgi:hypothetical protein